MKLIKNSVFCLLFSIFCFSLTGCYSFRGVTISPDTKTFSVSLFTSNAQAAPPTLAQNFTERLKDKIRNNTRLSLVNSDNANLTFVGQVVGYDIVAIAPQPGQVAQTNQNYNYNSPAPGASGITTQLSSAQWTAECVKNHETRK